MRLSVTFGLLLSCVMLFGLVATTPALATGTDEGVSAPTAVSTTSAAGDHTPRSTENHHPFAFILLELTLLLGMVIAARWLADRFKQPAVLGELIIGVVLGNIGYWLGLPFFSFMMDYGIASPLFEQVWRSGSSVVEAASHVFGPQELAPGGKGFEVVQLMTGHSGLTNVNIGVSMWLFSSLGIVLLLYNVGLDTRLHQLREVGSRAAWVAIIGVSATFLLGLAASTWLLADYPLTARIFLAAALCATSIGISTRVFKDLNKEDTAEGRIVLGACVLNDVLVLVLLAVCIELVLEGHIEYVATAWTIFLSSAFLGAIVVLADYFDNRISRLLSTLKANESRYLLPLAFAFSMGWFATQIGLSNTVGAFAAGLVISDESLRAKMKELVLPMVSVFTPIFFLLIGMQVNLVSFLNWNTPALTAVLLLVAVGGKLLAGLSAGRGVDRLSVGLGMLPRGEVALIFAGMGKSLGVIDNDAYAALILVIILMAFATTLTLKWSFAREAASAGS
jgi:Kef-type K+ transport system membrane component KefB